MNEDLSTDLSTKTGTVESEVELLEQQFEDGNITYADYLEAMKKLEKRVELDNTPFYLLQES